MAIEDLDINLPRASHSGTSAAENARVSLQAIVDCISLLAARSSNRFLTAELSISFVDRQANFSFAGFVKPLQQLLKNLAPLPGSIEDVATWCEQAHLSAKSLWPSAKYSREHLNLVDSRGSLIMRRTPATIEPVPGNSGEYGIAVGKGSTLAEALASGAISVVPQVEVRSATCSACRASYFDCACTALFSSDCMLSVQDCDIRGYVWTPRPASTQLVTASSRAGTLDSSLEE